MLRNSWKLLDKEDIVGKTFLSILHGAVEREYSEEPSDEKRLILGYSDMNLMEHLQENYLSQNHLIEVGNDLRLAGFKIPSLKSELKKILPYFGIISNISPDKKGEICVNWELEQCGHLMLREDLVPDFLKYSGAGICWVDKIYSDGSRLGRMEPASTLVSKLIA